MPTNHHVDEPDETTHPEEEAGRKEKCQRGKSSFKPQGRWPQHCQWGWNCGVCLDVKIDGT